MELAVAQAGSAAGRVEGVTGALSAALEHVGGEPATRDRVLDLCVDDRRWLEQ